MRTLLRRHLPIGDTLPTAEWERRHRVIVLGVWTLAVAVPLYGVAAGHSLPDVIMGGATLLALAALARRHRARRHLASSLASLGLCSACALAVHLSDGAIEAHFMFFVAVISWRLNEEVRAEARRASEQARTSDDRFRSAFDDGPLEDVSERNRPARELHDLAHVDPLTGLLNRRRFELELAAELERVRHDHDGGCVILVDLDDFKSVNDTLGHQVGDEMLVAAAHALRDRTRNGDVVARLGGDEFAVLIPGVDVRQARIVGESLVGHIAEWAVYGVGVDARRATASVGVVAYGRDTELTGDQMLDDADLAIYEAKEDGGNRCIVYSAGQEAVGARVSWPDRIRRALDDDGLTLYAQPILDLGTGAVTRYELLLRMIGTDGEIISPGAFLPVAERRGMIRMIDRWVVREAIGLLGQRSDDVRLQINVSARSLADPAFLDHIRGEFDASCVDPAGLVFEITETAAIANFEDARVFLTSLADLGCGIALDDFGAGFASFHYIKNLPFDELKIDGQFVQNLTRNADDLVLVETLVQLAHGLGKRTVAEYVEDAATLELIRAVGVDLAQGHFIGAPAPALALISAPVRTRL